MGIIVIWKLRILYQFFSTEKLFFFLQIMPELQ